MKHFRDLVLSTKEPALHTGTFIKNASATWDVTGVNGIPTGWTVETASS